MTGLRPVLTPDPCLSAVFLQKLLDAHEEQNIDSYTEAVSGWGRGRGRPSQRRCPVNPTLGPGPALAVNSFLQSPQNSHGEPQRYRRFSPHTRDDDTGVR